MAPGNLRLFVDRRSCPLSCQQTLKQLAVGGMAAQNPSQSFHSPSCLAYPETGQAKRETFLVSFVGICSCTLKLQHLDLDLGWKNQRYPQIWSTGCRLKRYDSLASVFGHAFVQKLQNLKCPRSHDTNRRGPWSDVVGPP